MCPCRSLAVPKTVPKPTLNIKCPLNCAPECEGALVCGRNNCPWGDGDDCCRQETISVEEAKGK